MNVDETVIKKRRLLGICVMCGEELHHFNRYKFCPYCGRKIIEIQTQTTEFTQYEIEHF